MHYKFVAYSDSAHLAALRVTSLNVSVPAAQERARERVSEQCAQMQRRPPVALACLDVTPELHEVLNAAAVAMPARHVQRCVAILLLRNGQHESIASRHG